MLNGSVPKSNRFFLGWRYISPISSVKSIPDGANWRWNIPTCSQVSRRLQHARHSLVNIVRIHPANNVQPIINSSETHCSSFQLWMFRLQWMTTIKWHEDVKQWAFSGWKSLWPCGICLSRLFPTVFLHSAQWLILDGASWDTVACCLAWGAEGVVLWEGREHVMLTWVVKAWTYLRKCPFISFHTRPFSFFLFFFTDVESCCGSPIILSRDTTKHVYFLINEITWPRMSENKLGLRLIRA